MQQNPEVFQREIKELEARLEAKKKEMAESGTGQTEKQIFKEVIKEHTGPVEATNISPAQLGQSQHQPVADEPTEEEKQKLNDLISHSFTKGIASAVSEAKKTKSPYLIDLLHDRLADAYYEKLLQSRKINPS